MLVDAAWRTLQILFFRAGPQDFPYDPRLAYALPAIAIAGNVLFLAVVLPLGMSVAVAVAIVGMLALYTRAVLRARNLLTRFQQTYNALITTDLALKLIMLPAFAMLAPKLTELAQKPELLEDPQNLAMPQGPVLFANVITYWSFAVSTNIYRHAAQISIPIGVLVALLGLIILLFATGFASGLVRALGSS